MELRRRHGWQAQICRGAASKVAHVYCAAAADDSGENVNYAFRIDGVTTTPEPATAALLAGGLVAMAGMGVVRRRRGRS